MISGQNTIGESRKADGVRISGRFPSLGALPQLLSPAHPERLRRLRPAAQGLRPAAQGVLLFGVALRREAPPAGCGAGPRHRHALEIVPSRPILESQAKSA